MEQAKTHYILVTPVKNEKDNLPRLIKSIKSQTLKPTLWVVVDDESTDGTGVLLEHLQSECDFVRITSSEEGKRDASIDRYGVIVRKGFDFAIEECKLHDLNYNYLGLVDADLWLEDAYFAKIVAGFERNCNVGMASGAIWEKIDDGFVLRQSSNNEPNFTAAGMVMRRRCYEEAGGFPTTSGPEFVLAIKVLTHGWKIDCFLDTVGIHMRRSGQKIGQWKGFAKCGEIHYMLNYHPVDALLLIGYFTFSKPYAAKGPTIAGLAFFWGYLHGFIYRKERIADTDVVTYFQRSWKHSVINLLKTVSSLAKKHAS